MGRRRVLCECLRCFDAPYEVRLIDARLSKRHIESWGYANQPMQDQDSNNIQQGGNDTGVLEQEVRQSQFCSTQEADEYTGKLSGRPLYAFATR